MNFNIAKLGIGLGIKKEKRLKNALNTQFHE